MIPFTLSRPQDSISVQEYVAIPGKSFFCRVDLKEDPPVGVQWGGRVCIDTGGVENMHVLDVDKAASREYGSKRRNEAKR